MVSKIYSSTLILTCLWTSKRVLTKPLLGVVQCEHSIRGNVTKMYKYIGNVSNVRIFSFNSKDTFGRAKTWVKELQRQASPNIVIALAGNKADLANKRMVEYEVKYCRQYRVLGFILYLILQHHHWRM